MGMAELMGQLCPQAGIKIDDQSAARFETYYAHLTEQNRVMNLTAITGEAETARLHFLDCLQLLKLVELENRRVIDVGTGAGFPGLPLKIARPSIELTLLDSLQKRVSFLEETCGLLGFSDVTCLHARAEEAATGELRERFDVALSRAVARLNLLSELCLPFVAVGGSFVAMKGPEAEVEVQEAARGISLLGGQVEKIWTYTIPGTELQHCAVWIKKIAPTPEKYPRRFAKIQKSPL
jgi:16S rRNA (guanine527-N7)-methyltransferase